MFWNNLRPVSWHVYPPWKKPTTNTAQLWITSTFSTFFPIQIFLSIIFFIIQIFLLYLTFINKYVLIKVTQHWHQPFHLLDHFRRLLKFKYNNILKCTINNVHRNLWDFIQGLQPHCNLKYKPCKILQLFFVKDTLLIHNYLHIEIITGITCTDILDSPGTKVYHALEQINLLIPWLSGTCKKR